jgi:hypothetical protein
MEVRVACGLHDFRGAAVGQACSVGFFCEKFGER